MGIGAFNLLTRSAYERIGTHRAFANRPDDDLQLGMRVKREGLRQRLYSADEWLEVEWYPNLREAVKGLEKNMFSGFGYRLSMAITAILGQAAVFVYPLCGLLLDLPLWASVLCVFSLILMMALYVVTVRALWRDRDSYLDALLLPVSSLLLIAVIIRSVLLTYWRGGIYWRGTFYPLRELRKQR